MPERNNHAVNRVTVYLYTSQDRTPAISLCVRSRKVWLSCKLTFVSRRAVCAVTATATAPAQCVIEPCVVVVVCVSAHANLGSVGRTRCSANRDTFCVCVCVRTRTGLMCDCTCTKNAESRRAYREWEGVCGMGEQHSASHVAWLLCCHPSSLSIPGLKP